MAFLSDKIARPAETTYCAVITVAVWGLVALAG
jgi:hypothetical protein